MTDLFAFFQPYYLILKWVHLFFVAMWAFSTAVAYRYYLVPVFRAWLANKDDAAIIEKRNWTFKAFDRGAVLEHVAFPIILVTGLMLVWLGGWRIDELNWLAVKLLIVALIFVPMEIVDYHISHFGGRKSLSLKTNDIESYERKIQFHWLFFRVTERLVVIFVPLVFFLAVVKPF